MSISRLLLTAAGVFTLALGILHFFFPLLLDFAHAIPREGNALKPFRLSLISYQTKRSDVYGIAWVMNHAASFVLVSIGVLYLNWMAWIESPLKLTIGLWIAGWWLLRAVSQLYVGKRPVDWFFVGWFALLGVIHFAVAIQ
ncbi:MAG: hypothetical protein KF726_21575 [Anaerolineae bacterium]|nr:hypothetical protein [Anaerolineae bacterium]